MAEIDVLQTGKMLVSSAVHNRDSKSGKFAYTGLFQSKKGRNDVPVKAFLIRINGKNVLVDTGWSEQCAINPRHHLGLALYFSSQPTVTLNDSVARQLDALGITPKQLDAVILTHLDCDHVSGLKDLKGAKHIYATKRNFHILNIMYRAGKNKLAPRFFAYSVVAGNYCHFAVLLNHNANRTCRMTGSINNSDASVAE